MKKMKQILYTLVFALGCNLAVYGQGATCADSEILCDPNVSFPATTGVGSLGFVGCLGATPNPSFYTIAITQSGNLVIDIAATSLVDIDFAIWGPYAGPMGNCGATFPTGPIQDCSFSGSQIEQANVPGVVAGQFYILLVTNFNGSPTDIEISPAAGNTAEVGGPLIFGNNGPFNINDPAVTLNTIPSVSDPGIVNVAFSGPGITDPALGIFDPVVAGPGLHPITLMADAFTCPVLVTTEILVTAPSVTASATPPIICQGESSQLNAVATNFTPLGYSWSPTTNLSDPNIANPVATPPITTNYTVTAITEGPSNLVTNGDFEAGNTGFTSGYTFNTTVPLPGGSYVISSNPQTNHGGFAPCVDHTSGAGNMMVVNAASVANVPVWEQTVTVIPNTTYVFYSWVQSVVAASPAILQFSVNGSLLGSPFTASPGPCVFDQFFTTWNSGAATTATIQIVNQNTAAGGNDFALDNIFFGATIEVEDDVDVTVLTVDAPTTTGETIDCGDPVVTGLSATCDVCPLGGGAGITWWNAAVGGTQQGMGGTLDPTGLTAEEGMVDLNTPGDYTFYAQCDCNGCLSPRTAAVLTVESACPASVQINVASDTICVDGGLLALSATGFDGGGNVIGCFDAAGTFSGTNVSNTGMNTGTFDPSGLTTGVYPIQYTYPCPNGDVRSTDLLIYVFEVPDASLMADTLRSCQNYPGTFYLNSLFLSSTTPSGDFTLISGPAGSSIDNTNKLLNFNDSGCYVVEYTAPDPADCSAVPVTAQSTIYITREPEPEFSFTGDAGGCIATPATVNVTLESPAYGPAGTLSRLWTISGGSVVGATTNNPTFTIDVPAAGTSSVVQICLEESLDFQNLCAGFPADVCIQTRCREIVYFNDGIDCASQQCDTPNEGDVCDIETNPTLDLACTTIGLDINVPSDLVTASLALQGGQMSVISCTEDEICIDYSATIVEDVLNEIQNGITGSSMIGNLPGVDVVCDIINFGFCVPIQVGPDVCIDPLDPVIPDGVSDVCDMTIGEVVVDAFGLMVGGDGGGYIVVADTDGDGAFDYALDEGDISSGDLSACLPNNVVGNGPVTIRVVSSWPQSPSDICGSDITEGPGLLELLPIGAIPLIGPPIEDLMAAGGCNPEIAFSDQQTMTVNVINDQAPIFVNCPDVNTIDGTANYIFSVSGDCGTRPNWSIPIANDGCDGSVLPFLTDMGTTPGVRKVSGPDPGDLLTPGSYTVVYEATSCNGMTNQCSIIILITDGNEPLLCSPDITVGTDVDACSAVVTGINPASGMTCYAELSYTLTGATVGGGNTDASGETFELGATTVTYTMMIDINGDGDTDDLDLNGDGAATTSDDEIQTCSFVVTVEDRQNPVAECLSFDLQLDDSGMGTLMADAFDAGSSDNCSTNLTIEVAKAGEPFGASVSFDCSELGNNFVNVSFTDEAGNVSTCIANVNVINYFEDFELQLDLPEICLDENNPSQLDFTNYLTITDPDGGLISHAAVGLLGPNVAGGFGISAFAPSAGSASTDPGTITPDGIYTPGTGSGFVTISYLLVIGGQATPAPDGTIEGCFRIVHETFELRQPLSMESPECVCVEEGLRIVDLGEISGGLEPYTIQYTGVSLDWNGDSVIDDTDGSFTYSAAMGVDINDLVQDLGELRVNYTQPVWSFTIIDARGCELFRSGSCDTADDLEGPVIDCLGANDLLDTEMFICESQYEWRHAIPTDNCAVTLYTYRIINPDGTIEGPFDLNALIYPGTDPLEALTEAEYEFQLGTSTISYYAEDAVGNSTICEFNVTVADNDPPYFTNCERPPVVESAPDGWCSAYVNFSLPQALDNCSMPTVTQIDNTGLTSGDLFPVGTTILVWEAVDDAGNTAQCELKIIVNDFHTIPTIECVADVVDFNDPGQCGKEVNNIAPIAVTDNCMDNTAVIFEVFDENGDQLYCGVEDASGLFFPVGTSTVNYTVSDQPIVLITEIVQDGVNTGVEITNFGPATVDISCAFLGLNSAVETDTFDIPNGTILPVGGVYTHLFNNVIPSNTASTFTFGMIEHQIDSMTINGDLFGSSILRKDVCDHDLSSDFFAVTDCNPPSFGALNDGLTIMTDNGTITALQNVPPSTASCSVVVSISDNEMPTCADPGITVMAGSGLPADIAPGNCTSSTVTFTEDLTVNDLNVNNLVITASDAGLLTATLISPSGTEVVLFSELCSGTADVNISFDDDALNLLSAVTCGPMGGGETYVSEEVLKAFLNESALGDWTLEVYTSGATGGTLMSWELEINDHAPYSQTDVELENDLGLCGALYAWTHPLLSDNCCVGTISVEYTTTDDINVPAGGPIEPGSEVTEFFEVGVTTVTYTLTDEAGNISQCAFTVTVNDTEPPSLNPDFCENLVFNLTPGDCDQFVNFELDPDILGTDNCGIVTVTYDPPSGTAFMIGVTQVTVTVTDPSGNTAECTFDVEIIEYIPDSDELACNDQINLSLDQNCEAVLTQDMILEGDIYRCYDNYCMEVTNEDGEIVDNVFGTEDIGMTFTVSIIDCLGGGNSCWGTVVVEEKIIPEFICAPDTTIACNALTDPLYLGYPELLTCEAQVNITYADNMTTYGECDDPRAEIIRTWYVDDTQGNVVTCDQTITILPGNLDDIDWPDDVSVMDAIGCQDYFNDPSVVDPMYTGIPTVNGLPLNQGALCNFYINITDEIYEGTCDGSLDILRVWRVRNTCEPISADNPREHVQVIRIRDRQDPVIDTCPDDITISTDPWNCAATAPMPFPERIMDYCGDVTFEAVMFGGGYIEVDTLEDETVVVIGYNMNRGDHTVRYFVTDDCGNVSVCEFVVTVVDETPPIAIAKQFIVVDLTSNGVGDGTAKLYAESVDNGSYDGCSDVHLELRRPSSPDDCGNIGQTGYNNNLSFNNDFHPNDAQRDTDDGAFVKFCCADLTDIDENGVPYGIVQVELRVWDDGDSDGVFGSPGDSYNTTWADVRVEEKLPPVIICPADITVTCEEDYQNTDITGVASAYGTCSASEVEYNDIVVNINTCQEGFVIRRWSVPGTSVQCDQRIDIIRVGDPFTENNINWARDDEATCAEVDEGETTWIAAPCDVIAASVIQRDTFPFEEGSCMKIVNVWRVIDWCAYDASNGTAGYWDHTQILKILDDIAPEMDCEDEMFEVNDNADVDEDGNICEYRNLTLTNVATDSGECASDWLKWSVDVDLWADGTVDYEFSSFLPPFNPFYLEPTASGEEVSVTIPEDIEGNMSNHKVFWTVTDGCGNVTSCDNGFMVVDKKAPTPYCINASSALMKENGQVELWATDFNQGSFDNCTPQDMLRYTFSDVPPEDDPAYIPENRSSSMIFDCTHLNEEVEVHVYVWDEKGNKDFCIVTLTVVDYGGFCDGMRIAVGGTIANEDEEMIEGVEVSLDGNIPEYPKTTETDQGGGYALYDNPMSLDYTVEASKTGDWKNGVSTLDLLLIQRHILGLSPLDSPYKMIAADVRSDGYIRGSDIVELRKLILNVITELSNNESWRFVDAATTVTTTPQISFEEVKLLPEVSTDMMSEDFIGVKIGDVNGDATANLQSEDTEVRSDKALNLLMEEKEVNAGERIEIVITSSNFKDVYGYQFTMELNGLRFEDVESGVLAMEEQNVGVISDNIVTVSYGEANAISATEGETLFTLVMKAERSGRLSDMITITSRLTSAEAYIGESMDITDVKLNSGNGTVSGEYALYQNEPNPFKSRTTIGFNMAERGQAIITMYNVSGQVIKVIDGEFDAGYNEVVFDRQDTEVSGVLYYKLETGAFSAVKKMIVIR